MMPTNKTTENGQAAMQEQYWALFGDQYREHFSSSREHFF
jgi:hypothetical protein